MKKSKLFYYVLLAAIVVLFVAARLVPNDIIQIGLMLALDFVVLATLVCTIAVKSYRKNWWMLGIVILAFIGVRVGESIIHDKKYGDPLNTPVLFKFTEKASGSSVVTTLERTFHSDLLFVHYEEIYDYVSEDGRSYEITDQLKWVATPEKTNTSLVEFDLNNRTAKELESSMVTTIEDINWGALNTIYESLADSLKIGKVYFQQENNKIYWRF